MTAPGNTPATDDLWAELDAIAARADAWAETLARFLHPSAWTDDDDTTTTPEGTPPCA